MGAAVEVETPTLPVEEGFLESFGLLAGVFTARGAIELGVSTVPPAATLGAVLGGLLPGGGALAIISWYFLRCSGLSMAEILLRRSAASFSMATARCDSSISRKAMKLGRISALIASSLLCCSVVSCNSLTKRSRKAAPPPPPP